MLKFFLYVIRQSSFNKSDFQKIFGRVFNSKNHSLQKEFAKIIELHFEYSLKNLFDFEEFFDQQLVEVSAPSLVFIELFVTLFLKVNEQEHLTFLTHAKNNEYFIRNYCDEVLLGTKQFWQLLSKAGSD